MTAQAEVLLDLLPCKIGEITNAFNFEFGGILRKQHILLSIHISSVIVLLGRPGYSFAC